MDSWLRICSKIFCELLRHTANKIRSVFFDILYGGYCTSHVLLTAQPFILWWSNKEYYLPPSTSNGTWCVYNRKNPKSSRGILWDVYGARALEMCTVELQGYFIYTTTRTVIQSKHHHWSLFFFPTTKDAQKPVYCTLGWVDFFL
jgi:hypothetical protein